MEQTYRGIIELSVPLRDEFAATLRVLSASVGADAGFDIEAIDDLRLGVSEVFNLLADIDGDHRCDATFAIEAERVEIVIARRPKGSGDDPGPVELDGLASTILSSVVDEHRVEGNTVTLVKSMSTAVDDNA